MNLRTLRIQTRKKKYWEKLEKTSLCAIWAEQHAQYISITDQPGGKRMYHHIKRAKSFTVLTYVL